MKKSVRKNIIGGVIAIVVVVGAILLAINFGVCGIYFSTTDWVVGMIEKYYYYDVSEEDVRAAGLDNLSGNVLDIYSGFYTSEEYDEMLQSNAGNNTGIGVSYSYIDNSFERGIFINEVVGNSPAYLSGLREGTFVLGANDADGNSAQFNSTASFSDYILAHDTGEKFTLITDRGEYEVSREDYHASYCFMATADTEWSIQYNSSSEMQVVETPSTKYSYLPEGTAYMKVTQFFGNAAYEVAELMREFNAENCTSLIFDLRNNGGGYVDVMQSMSHVFIGDRDYMPAAMTARYKDGKETVFNVNAIAQEDCLFPAECSLYVLANNGTASASEALIGVLVSNGVVDYSDIYLSDYSQTYLEWSGTQNKNCRTYGKGIMQTTFRYFVTGDAIKLTTAKIYWPNGKCIHDVGLTVEDGCETVPAEWSITYADEELQSAVAMIAG